jgi:hypothetical protein
VTVGIMLETFTLIHYWAPVIPLNYFFTVQAIRLWRRRDQRIGPMICPVLIILALALLVVLSIRRVQEISNPLASQIQRANLSSQLE